MGYFCEYPDFDCSDLEDSIKDQFQSRMKKSNKMMGKKFRLFKILTRHYSRRSQRRKNGWKRNYESKGGYTNFHENILEEEIQVKIQTKENDGERKKNYKSKCECIHFHQERDFPDNHEDILEGEAPLTSFVIEYDERDANEFGVIEELCTTTGNFSIDIPEELLIEVLSRLSLKSIARFKCVSKQWQHMILNNVSVKDAPKLLILCRLDNGGFSFHSLGSEARVERMYSPMEEHLLRGHIVKAHSSCHGLLLIQIDYNLFVWNPLTKFLKKMRTHYGLGYRNFLADLCFDSSNDEYTVVVVEKIKSYYEDREYFYLASCRTNRWEIIDVPGNVKNLSQGPFFKGYRHWISKGRSPTLDEFHNNSFIHPQKRIVSFDPSTKMFIELPTPKPKNGDHNFLRDTFLGLGVIDECLCINRWFRSWGGNIEFLVMKEYGNEDSWVVMFVFSNLPEYFCYGAMEPLFKTKEGELLFNMNMCYRSTGVKAYDVDHNILRDILSWTRKGSFDAVLYEESCYDSKHFFSNCEDPDSPSSFSEHSYYWDRFSDYWEDDREDFYDEEYSNFDQWELEDFVEVEFLSRLNRWNKKMKKKKKAQHVKIATKCSRKYCSRHALVEIQIRKEKWKGNKRNYKSKCRYISIHDMILPGNPT